MCFIKMSKKLVKKMKWYDLSLIKASVFFFTLFLITVWPAFNEVVMGIEWYWYLILTIIFAGPLFDKLTFCKG